MNGIIGLASSGVKSHELMKVSPEGTSISVGGSSGYVHILNGKLKTETSRIKMNSIVKSISYHDENTLITSGVDADVYIWDLRKSSRCVERY
jgi:WD40 repeat protein